METEAKWPAKSLTTACFVALRKQKRPPQSSSLCPSMKPHHFDLLIGRPSNHISFVKVLVLLLIVVLLLLNLFSYTFNYPFLLHPILSFSSFSLSFDSNSSSSSSSFPPDLNSYAHANLDDASPPPSLNSSSPSPTPSFSLLQSPSSLISLTSPPPQPTSQPSPYLNPMTTQSLQPVPSPSDHHSSDSKPSKPTVSRKAAKSCDLSRGEWVRDWNAPYYTNMTCYTIQEHQNCMKYGRPNLDYLKWRWKPDGCELPLFDPEEFLELMRGKTLAFVGDSLARNQMQSLMCLLSRVRFLSSSYFRYYMLQMWGRIKDLFIWQ